MDILSTLRYTKAEINIDALKENFKSFKEYLNPTSNILAVVKSNGYGHGITEVGEVFYNLGATYLGVANFGEGVALKRYNCDFPVLIMGYTQENQIKDAISLGITLTISSFEEGKVIDKVGRDLGVKPKVHLKVNTGFNRLGVKPCDLKSIAPLLSLENIVVEGVFSHLALTGPKEDHIQYNLFMECVDTLKSYGFTFRYTHICDSLGGIRYPEFHLDLVRAGTILYGCYNGDSPISLKNTISLKSKISKINYLDSGEGVSYDYFYKVDRPSKIAVLPLGYSDGVPRSLWKGGRVFINGHYCKIAGIICMDQMMVDVTDLSEVSVGDNVEIFGENISLEEVASIAGTNKNQLMSSISKRVPLVYKEDNRVVKIVDGLLGEWCIDG